MALSKEFIDVVTDCVLLKSPGDLTALRCSNAETRSWLSELPIELWFLIISLLFDKRLYIYIDLCTSNVHTTVNERG